MSQVDILATIGAVNGIATEGTEGSSLLSAGPADRWVRTGARSSGSYPIVGIRRGSSKLLAVPSRAMAPVDSLLNRQLDLVGPAFPRLLLRAWRLELYDLEADPEEQDDELRSQLRDLGYVR